MSSRVVRFRYELLNRYDLKIGDVPVLSGSVRLNALAQIKRTGNFTLQERYAKDIDFLNDRLKPFMEILEGEKWKSYPLGIYLLPSPRRDKSNSRITRSIEAYDVCQILIEDKLYDRLYVGQGESYVSTIRQLVHSAGISRMFITDSNATLRRDREFEIGTPKLNIINDLLNEMNYTSLYANEEGVLIAEPYVLPEARSIDFEYRNDELSVCLDAGTSEELDVFNVPNVFILVASNSETAPLKSIYENKNPASKISTVQRGRRIVDFRNIDDTASQSALDGMCKRIAYDASNVYQKLQFRTILQPGHGFSNALLIEDSELNISGRFSETEWSMELKAGGEMTHMARRIIRL